ncbi:hypothetical protein BDR06DRAFT_870579, partial [Suillus hirtellus]
IKLMIAFSKWLTGVYFALWSQHISLNQHLHHIGKHLTPSYPHCPGVNETVTHYILDCPQYHRE